MTISNIGSCPREAVLPFVISFKVGDAEFAAIVLDLLSKLGIAFQKMGAGSHIEVDRKFTGTRDLRSFGKLMEK